ncbi:hypothetical protein D9758_016062 [Tetrapyrgos nigripes]|uniref:Uncharacterized protein n=1 Tax=Tetrapyrgos nigripes TaxID=182062 RepID=A0A8H5C802_9AGAR|nr:hypothetical protein D9758_016062 [Tetrapyrgos nigripes]
MGQRHQVFVIARLVPHGSTTGQAFYRCIAAHHHQFCYGSLPLRGVNRFLALLRNENNASIIRDEIRRVQGVYGRRGESPYMPLMPCPYTLFLLSLAWNVDMGDLEQPYFSGAGFDSCVFSPNMGSFAGDNDDGITVIDVTDPADPAYCFIRSRRSGPVDMRGYVRHYYNLDAIMKKREGGGDAEDDDTTKRTPLESAVVEVVAALEGVRLVTLGMLAEVWPHEYKPHDNEAITDNAERQAEANPITSLVELSIAPAVEHSLSTDDTSELEGIVWQPGKAELVKKALMARNPFPDNGISLLVKLLEHDLESTNPFILDLSFYPSLSPEQVLRVVTTLSKTFLDIKSLNLTGNHNISTSTVAEVLKVPVTPSYLA